MANNKYSTPVLSCQAPTEEFSQSYPQRTDVLKQNVPAEGSSSPYTTLISSVEKLGSTLQQGHCNGIKQPGKLKSHWDKVEAIVWRLMGDNKRTVMVMEVLRLQWLCGQAFPSAKYLGSRVGARTERGAQWCTFAECPGCKRKSCEKAWDRCLGFLKEQGLVNTTRLFRTRHTRGPRGDLKGTQSVNLIDLTKLWKLVLALLDKMLGSLKHWQARILGSRLWIKISGIWLSPLEVIKVLNKGEPELQEAEA